MLWHLSRKKARAGDMDMEMEMEMEDRSWKDGSW